MTIRSDLLPADLPIVTTGSRVSAFGLEFFGSSLKGTLQKIKPLTPSVAQDFVQQDRKDLYMLTTLSIASAETLTSQERWAHLKMRDQVAGRFLDPDVAFQYSCCDFRPLNAPAFFELPTGTPWLRTVLEVLALVGIVLAWPITALVAWQQLSFDRHAPKSLAALAFCSWAPGCTYPMRMAPKGEPPQPVVGPGPEWFQLAEWKETGEYDGEDFESDPTDDSSDDYDDHSLGYYIMTEIVPAEAPFETVDCPF